MYGDYKELSNNLNTEWTTKEMHVLHPTAGLFQLGHSLVTVSVMCIEGWSGGHLYMKGTHTLLPAGLKIQSNNK